MNTRDIPVVILAGGMGMRIREESEFRPKPMIEIGERPILWHIMKLCAHQGFRRFILCLGYKGQIIKRYFLHYEYMHSDFTVFVGEKRVELHHPSQEKEWIVTLAETGLHAMTGARLRRARPFVGEGEFLLTYGDGLADVDLKALLRFHRSHGRAATVTGVRPPGRFGELEIKGRRVARFLEKPSAGRGRINGGFFALDGRVFDYLSDKPSCTFEREPLERLAADKELMIHPHDGFWQCMDTMRDRDLLNSLWESGKAPWKLWKG